MNLAPRINNGLPHCQHSDATEAGLMRTRSVSRALTLVKVLLESDQNGLRLSEFVERTGNSKTTTHRLLQELVASGLLVRDLNDRSCLGPLAYQLGVRATNEANYNLQGICSLVLNRIAEQTGETVFLGIRSGQTGLFTVDRVFRSKTSRIVGPPQGLLYPLGVAAGG